MVITVMLAQGSAGAYCACSFLFIVILFDLIYLCTLVGFMFLYISFIFKTDFGKRVVVWCHVLFLIFMPIGIYEGTQLCIYLNIPEAKHGDFSIVLTS